MTNYRTPFLGVLIPSLLLFAPLQGLFAGGLCPAMLDPKVVAFASQASEVLAARSGAIGLQAQRFGTTIYYQPPYVPQASFPELDQDTKAVVITFGGSGVSRVSGQVWMQDAAALKRYGIATIAFDYPFHGAGPRNSKYNDPSKFLAMIFEIIKYFKSSGLPVYGLGQSFGPAILKEIMHLSPNLLRGAIMVSPGGSMSPELHRNMLEIIANGTLEAQRTEAGIVWDDTAEHWSDLMEEGFASNKGQSIRSQTACLMIAGDQDPWSKPELLETEISRYANGQLEIYPGLGHQSMIKADGKDERIVIERILALISQTENFTLKRSEVRETPSTRFRYWVSNSAHFRAWLERRQIRSDIAGREDIVLTRLVDAWIKEFKVELVQQVRTVLDPSDYGNLLSLPPEQIHENDINLLMKKLLVAFGL